MERNEVYGANQGYWSKKLEENPQWLTYMQSSSTRFCGVSQARKLCEKDFFRVPLGTRIGWAFEAEEDRKSVIAFIEQGM